MGLSGPGCWVLLYERSNVAVKLVFLFVREMSGVYRFSGQMDIPPLSFLVSSPVVELFFFTLCLPICP